MPTKKNKKTKETKKNCFVIAPIGEEGSDIRKRSDQVLKHVITPAVSECGYKPIRADKISEPGMITIQVIQHIADDPMVIADLSGMNANVFYELAVRHAIKKPVIQIIGRGERIPFDVAATRIIFLDHTDLDNVEEAKKEIIKQIKAAEDPKFEPETPISVAVQLQSLLSSEQPEDKRFGELLSSIQEIQKSVIRCERRLYSPQDILPPHYLIDVLRHTSKSGIRSEYFHYFINYMNEFMHIFDQYNKKPTQVLRKRLKSLAEKMFEIANRGGVS